MSGLETLFGAAMSAMGSGAGAGTAVGAGTAAAGATGATGAAVAGGLTAAEEAAALAAAEGTTAGATSSSAMLPAAQGASMAVQGNSGGALPFLMKAAMAGNSMSPLQEAPSVAPMLESPISFSQGMHPILAETSQGLEDTMAPGISDNNAMPLFKYQPPANPGDVSRYPQAAYQNLTQHPSEVSLSQAMPPPVTPTMAPQGVQPITPATPFEKAMGQTADVAKTMLLREPRGTPATVMAGRSPGPAGKVQLGAPIKRSSPLERYSRFLQGIR